jgi:hypothetical protein
MTRRAGEPLHRSAVLAYRLRANGLATPAKALPGVLDVGVQDTPPGATAPLALRARGTAAEPYDDGDLALVHSVRGTMHLHLKADLPLLAAALRPDDADDLLVSVHGQFFRELSAARLAVSDALDAVAEAMRRVMSGGEERAKGELSGAVTPLVPEALTPWCGGCGVRHVHDGLFRMATLQAGLRLRPTGDGSAVFLAPVRAVRASPPSDVSAGRRELMRRFLRRCGPADPGTLAAWLGLSPRAARRWWSLLADDLVEVDVEGQRLWTHRGDLDDLAGAEPVPGARALPAYDPVVEVADRALLVPDPVRRRQVWRAAANPGVVLLDGEVAGFWRRRRESVTVTAFQALPAGPVAGAVAALLAPAEVAVIFAQ